MIVAAIAIHVVMALITMSVNVPLNNGIKGAGAVDRIHDVGAVRRDFNERRWVRANAVRTLAATVAFGLLAWSLVLYGAS